MSDKARLVLMAVVTSFLPMLVGLGIITLDLTQTGLITTFVNNATLAVMYFWKAKPEPGASPVIGAWVAEMRRVDPETCWYRDADSVCSLSAGHDGGVHG